MTYKPSDTQLAWLAGFWDGEGCISLLNTGSCSHYPVFSLSQAGDEGLALCQRVVDSCGLRASISGPSFDKRNPNGKPAYKVRISGVERVGALLDMCWPWLSETKREQGAEALRLAYENNNFRVLSPFCGNGHRYTPETTRITPQGHRRCKPCRWKNPPPPDPDWQTEVHGPRKEWANVAGHWSSWQAARSERRLERQKDQ